MNIFNIKNHLIYTTKLDNFFEVFLFASFLMSFNVVLYSYANSKKGMTYKIKNFISTKFDISNKYSDLLVEFIFHFIITFIHLYILYLLFGYGISSLGPCQKIIKCK